ncbi:cytochrome P450 [Streptomyces triticagri]|uniref:Cytochrome P450 n=1 Tax=Streptomyces triticagri TaxID=2293568 RepID=A0A372LYQ2_9ACTN|nr:cytochrome P450 [Streptomyces triticagri]
MFDEEFARDPAGVYDRLRGYGVAAPVALEPGVQALLVTHYKTARYILTSPDFSKDPHRWRDLREGRVPADSRVLPMMAPRPNCLFSDDTVHQARRQVVDESLGKIDDYELRRYVEQVADDLIDSFARTGRADLIAQYAKRLPLMVFNKMFGCPGDVGDRLVEGMGKIFDGVEAESGNVQVTEGLIELITHKQAVPGSDVTTWMLQHASRPDAEEVIHQLVTLLGAGSEAEQNLIGNALLKILTDPRFADDRVNVPIGTAIEEVLWQETPLANYAVHYARRPVDIYGTHFPEGIPIVISFAACNTDPEEILDADQRATSRSHLSWSAGPHRCPAQPHALSIGRIAIERLFNRLPDVQIAVDPAELTWRTGPFHRALHTLPAQFTPHVVTEPPAAARAVSPAVPRPGAALATLPDSGPVHPVPARRPRSPLRRLAQAWLRWWRGDT